MKLNKININTLNQKYQVIIGNNILNNIQKLLKESSINYNQSLIVVDKKVPVNLIKKILASLKKKPKNEASFIFFWQIISIFLISPYFRTTTNVLTAYLQF